MNLLSDINNLRRIRITSASQDSLVPVGDDGIAFVSDDVRYGYIHMHGARYVFDLYVYGDDL